MDSKHLVLSLHAVNHIAAQQHLHLRVAILKELVLCDLGLVAKQIDLTDSKHES